MANVERVEIGFEGGQVISVRLAEEELKELRRQLQHGGWHDVETEEGIVSLYLGKVSFLRVGAGASQVGFSLGSKQD